MVEPRMTNWLRPFVTLLALAGVLSLAACGGGNGAPNNPYNNPGPAPLLTVLPLTTTVYAGVPATVSITGGTAPFTLFSSNAAILPVTPGPSNSTTIPLLAAAVNAATPVTLTIQDASGQTTNVAVTVQPSLLLPASITITGNPVCAGSNALLCSGQDGTATVVVTGPGGATLAGRQVRFDVVLGTFSLVAANSSTPAQSVTVQTDQNGLAAVTIRVPVNAVTQFATVRATDVSSGSSVIGQCTIAQFVNGNSVLSVIPTGTTTFNGADTAHCSSGVPVNFYVFGGTPPYNIALSFPTAVTLLGSPVLQSGGAFTIVSNGSCFTGLTFSITDSAGRTLLTPPLVDSVLGTAEPPPPGLVITPGRIPASGSAACAVGSTFQFLATGGTGKYNATVVAGSSSTGTVTAAVTEGTIAVSIGGATGDPPAHGTFTINVSSGTQIQTAVLSCS